MTWASRQLEHLSSLAPADQDAIRALAIQVEQLDDAEPLNEHSLLRLSATAPELAHVLAHDDTAVTGYAQVELVDPATAEVLVAPTDDRAALAGELVAAAEELSGPQALLIWSRGATSPVGAVLTARGYTPDRVMLTMRRPLAGLGAQGADAPDGLRIRRFVPGQDDDAWLAVNAAAFASHPEQGAWGPDDLHERMAQPWFDPFGFFVAEDTDGTMLGYHWTKQHPPAEPGEPPLAEVYVFGIAPAAQGRGLGRVLLDVGLRHLAAGPARDVVLYVEQANASALRLYQRDGFALDRRDVQFRRPATVS